MPKSNSSNSQSKRVGEKIKACAFKKLICTFKNKFCSSVPFTARIQLTPAQNELMEFLRTVLARIPPLVSSKKISADADAYSTTSSNDDNEFVDATFPNLLGFCSYNQDFQKRMTSDRLMTAPLLLLLQHYQDYRTKYAKEYAQIFAETKIKCQNFLAQTKLGEEKNLSKSQIKKQSFERFLSSTSLDQLTINELQAYLNQDRISDFFYLLVKRVSSGLTIRKLHDCFELYLILLEAKYMQQTPLTNQFSSETPLSYNNSQQKTCYNSQMGTGYCQQAYQQQVVNVSIPLEYFQKMYPNFVLPNQYQNNQQPQKYQQAEVEIPKVTYNPLDELTPESQQTVEDYFDQDFQNYFDRLVEEVNAETNQSSNTAPKKEEALFWDDIPTGDGFDQFDSFVDSDFNTQLLSL